MIIAFANTKGGVGKTTSAMLTALALAPDHEDIVVMDADPQGSASQWAMTAADNGQKLPFEVQAVNQAILRRLKSTDRVVIIDTPPNDAGVVEMVARTADLTVVPTATSGLDMARTWETYAALEGLPRAVLVTVAEQRTLLFQEAVQALDAQGAARFQTIIPKRQAIKDAYGHKPTELHGYELFAPELLAAVS